MASIQGQSESRAAGGQRSELQRRWAERVTGTPSGLEIWVNHCAAAMPGAALQGDGHRPARDRERRIFTRHVLHGESFVAIARDLRISPQRVAQIAHRAAERLAVAGNLEN